MTRVYHHCPRGTGDSSGVSTSQVACPPVNQRARTADRGDLDAIESAHGAAFEDDPVARWIVGESRSNVQRIGAMYRFFAVGHLDDGLSAITPNAEAVAIWAAPKRFKVPVRSIVGSVPALISALGIRGTARLVSMSEMERLHPPEPHYYLAALGTRPEHQGKGFASATMQPTLRRADEEGTGCFLESSKEQNLAFYSRHGFEVIRTHDVARGKGPRMWLMWREPRPPGE